MDSPTNASAAAGPAPVVAAPAPAPAAPVVAEASPAAVAPAPVVAAPAAARPDFKAMLAKATPAERLLIATGKISEIKPSGEASPAPAPVAAAPAAAPAEPAPAPVVEPVPAAAPAAPAPTAEGENPGEEPGSEGRAKRFRFSSDDDQAVAQLAKSRNISLVEAARIYAGDAPPAVAAAAPVPAAPVAPVPDAVVTSLETRIAESRTLLTELTAKRTTAIDNLEHGEAATLNDQIAGLTVDVRLLENEKQGHLRSIEQATQSTYDKGVNAARDRVFGEYPAFAAESSMERLALDAYVTKALRDPSRKAEFTKPNWPEAIAKEFAGKMGIKPKAAAAGPAPAPVPAPVVPSPFAKAQPKQVDAKSLTGSDGKTNPAGQNPLTRERALTLIRTDPEARRAIMRGDYPGAKRN